MISIIVAMAENHVIGKNNKMPWHIPGDLKRFKELTTPHTIVMGRKTFESLPNGALPQRRNLVISRNKNLQLKEAEVVHSLEDALSLCSENEEVFIIGGGEIFKQSLEIADKIYITQIHATLEGDTFFPELDMYDWEVLSQEKHQANEKNPFAYSFVNLQRIF